MPDMTLQEACTILREHDYSVEINQFASNYWVVVPPTGGQKVMLASGVVQEASRYVILPEDITPLSEQEQHDLIALFQAFLKLKHAPDLRLHFYADTGGGLTDTSGATKNDEKLFVHWHDMSEGLAMIEAMRAEESEQTVW